MRLTIILAGFVGFFLAVAIALLAVLLIVALPTRPTADIPPIPHTPTETPPPTPTPTPVRTFTPGPTPPPTATPPPIARCLTPDGRSLDAEKLLLQELLESAARIAREHEIAPAIPSIGAVDAVNVRHQGGGTYLHTATYLVVTQAVGSEPNTYAIPVSALIDSRTCAADLR